MLDLGGESSRPGSAPVLARGRAAPRRTGRARPRGSSSTIPISVDTTKAEVARPPGRRCRDHQRHHRAGRRPRDGASRRRHRGWRRPHAHARPPATMQDNPRYLMSSREVYDFLAFRVEWAEARGIPRERIAVDPGIGFGKTVATISRSCGTSSDLTRWGVRSWSGLRARGFWARSRAGRFPSAAAGLGRLVARRVPSRRAGSSGCTTSPAMVDAIGLDGLARMGRLAHEHRSS